GAGDIGEADTGLLEHRAVAQDAGAAPTTGEAAGVAGGAAFPAVLDEAGAAVGVLDGGADSVLQAGEVVADAGEVGGGIGAAHAADSTGRGGGGGPVALRCRAWVTCVKQRLGLCRSDVSREFLVASWGQRVATYVAP